MTENHPLHGVDWRAVAVGILSALAFRKLLMLLGGGLGIWSFQVVRTAQLGNGFLLWSLLSLVVSLFLGGYLAAATSPNLGQRESALLGFLIWASVLAARFLSIALSNRGLPAFTLQGAGALGFSARFAGELVGMSLAIIGALQGRQRREVGSFGHRRVSHHQTAKV